MDWSSGLTKVISLIAQIYDIIMIAIPITLLLMGTIDLVKALTSGDDRGIKGAMSVLVKRLIMAAAAFLVMAIIKIVIGLVGGDSPWTSYWNR